jgi:hypothetical protein
MQSKCVWQCDRTESNRLSVKCPGRCHTSYIDSKFLEPVTVIKDHNHIPMPEKLDAVLSLAKMIERAKLCQILQMLLLLVAIFI